jgi:hypothetical protein
MVMKIACLLLPCLSLLSRASYLNTYVRINNLSSSVNLTRTTDAAKKKDRHPLSSLSGSNIYYIQHPTSSSKYLHCTLSLEELIASLYAVTPTVGCSIYLTVKAIGTITLGLLASPTLGFAPVHTRKSVFNQRFSSMSSTEHAAGAEIEVISQPDHEFLEKKGVFSWGTFNSGL